jgi:hypothetical protein
LKSAFPHKYIKGSGGGEIRVTITGMNSVLIKVFKEMELSFCYISTGYLGSLRGFESQVPLEKNRFLLEVLVLVNDKNYFVPLTTPQKKQKNMSDAIDFIKIDDANWVFLLKYNIK